MKILIAEDDRAFQVLLGKTLSQWGYEVIPVEDGEQALQHLSSNRGPRLAILDWMMPQLNGVEVCQRVRNSSRPHYVYMILLTAKGDMEDLTTGFEAGADDYIAKPVRLNELRLRLRSGCRVLEAQERQRVFSEAASDGVLTIEGRDRIQFANHAAGVIFGHPAGELAGRHVSDFIPEFRQSLENTSPRSDLNEGCRSWPLIELVGKRGKDEFFVEASFSEFFDHDQKKILTAVIRDVTERRSRERQQAQAQRLESIGQLAAGIAHEINTPIQYIGDNATFLDEVIRDLLSILGKSNGASTDQSAAGVVEELTFITEEAPKAIQQINEGVRNVARIVRAMKEFAHPGPVEKVPTDLNRAIENTVVISRNEWKYCAEMTTDLDPELPPVPCVSGEFEQVILNLIVNAAHAITDVTAGTGRKGEIHITTRHSNGCAEIRVRDTGGGIPEAIRSKIFDPFFTTKGAGKGTGQGLAIAHAVIVRKHHGELSFDTQMGVGTTFCIRLPLSCDESAPSESHNSGTSEHEPAAAKCVG